MRRNVIAAAVALAALARTAPAQETATGWANPAGFAAAARAAAALKTSATTTAETPATAPAVYTTASLLKMHRAELEALYKTLAPGPIPDGQSNGLASSDPGTTVGDISEGLFGLLWKGKVFDRAHGELINRIGVGGAHLVAAKVFYGPSWLDGRPSVIVDYQETSRIAGFIRDEIREASPGVYYGFAYARQPDGAAPRADIVFALDFNGPQEKAASPAP
jgi:hypothetical protein